MALYCPRNVSELAIAIGDDIHKKSPILFGGVTENNAFEDTRTAEQASMEAAGIWREKCASSFACLASKCEQIVKLHKSKGVSAAVDALGVELEGTMSWLNGQPYNYLEDLLKDLIKHPENLPTVLGIIAQFSRGET